MELYDEFTREKILCECIDKMKEIEAVKGIVLVGSGAIGFQDRYSDLDFCIVVEDGTDILSLMKKIKSEIVDKYSIAEEVCIPPRNLQILLLDNYLEIDLGYAEYSKILALRENWKVVYDEKNDINERFVKSWQDNQKRDAQADLSNIYLRYSKTIYTYIFHAVTAMKRNQKWRAVGETNLLRDIAIELLGYHYSVETKRYKNVHLFPGEVLEKLDLSLCDYSSRESMKQSVICLIQIIYDELDCNLKNKDYVGCEDMLNYVRAVLG